MQNIKQKRLILAFTLAEILIVLGIAGIIAEITIPALMQNVENAKFSTAAKKAYSSLNSATSMLITDNGGLIWDTSIADPTQISLNMKDAYKKYFNYIKEDTINNIMTDNWLCYKNYSVYCASPSATNNRYGLLLKDGSVIYFYGRQNCFGNYLGINNLPYCGGFNIDVNGNQKPNMYGKDVVNFFLMKDSNGNYKLIYPTSTMGFSCQKGSASEVTSGGCTEYIMQGGTLP